MREYKGYRFGQSVREFLGFMLFLICLYATVWSLLWLINEGYRTKCETNAGEMGVEYRYDMVNGCRLGIDGKFINWDLIVIPN